MLLERARELGVIEGALGATLNGNGSALMIDGKAGSGKTSLLTEAARLAAESSVEALSGRATELEGDFPFAVVRQLLETRLRIATASERDAMLEGAGAARGALGFDGGDAEPPDAFSVLHALYWVVVGLAEQTPLLLAIDDAHLADPASLDWLGFMLPRLHELPVLLVLTARADEMGSAGLSRILADPAVDHLSAEPLSAVATGALVEAGLEKQLDPAFAAACHETTGGNPFLVTELTRELADQGIEPRAGEVGSVRALAPQRVAQTVAGRLARLPPQAAALARALAIIGDGGDPSLAAALAELDPETARRAADLLRKAAVFDSGEALRFTHPLVRNAVYAAVLAGERGNAHAEAAALMRARGRPPEAVATQVLASEPRGDRAAVETLLEAARRSLADGARSAVSHLTRALREPPPPDLRTEVMKALLGAGIRAADHEALAAVEADLRALLQREPASARDLAVPLTMGMALRGSFAEAAEVLQAAIENAVGEGDVESAFRFEAQLRTLAVIVPGLPETDLQRYTAEVEPDSPAGRLAAVIEARAAIVNGGAAEASEAARRALGNDCSIFEEEPEIASAMTAVLILFAADELGVAGRAADRALEIARERDAPPELSRAWLLRGYVAVGHGDLLAAETDMRQAMELARLAEIVPMSLMCAGPLVEVLIERGDLEAAEAVLEETGVADGPIPQNALFSILQLVRGHLRFERAELEPAAEDFATLAEMGDDLGFGPGPMVMGSPFACRALVATGRGSEARELAESCLYYGRRWGAPATVSHVLRAAAAAEGGAREIELLEEAVSVLDGSPRRLQLANALFELGAALRRQNRRMEARVPLRDALKLARRCGAGRLAGRARQELQATGETVRRYAPIGAESLTPSERRVAEMAATGLTNRQIAQTLFVTLKTVEAHLSAAYDKLDISSRRQLRDALSQSPPPTE